MLEKIFFRINANIKKMKNDITVFDSCRLVTLFEKGFIYAFIICEKGIVPSPNNA